MSVDHPTWLPMMSPNCYRGRPPGVHVHGIVMHFTAGGSGKSSAEYFSKQSVTYKDASGNVKTAKVQASAHLVIDRDGTIYQCVRLADRAWHAGPAKWWKGLPLKPGENVNDGTIGIELANWGQLKIAADHSYVNYLGKPYKGPSPYVAYDAKHMPSYWEPFPEAQVLAAIAAAKVITNKYQAITRDDVLGHRDIDPARKVDPGPAWPMERFLDAVFGDDEEQALLLNAAEDDDRRGHYDEHAQQCLTEPLEP